MHSNFDESNFPLVELRHAFRLSETAKTYCSSYFLRVQKTETLEPRMKYVGTSSQKFGMFLQQDGFLWRVCLDLHVKGSEVEFTGFQTFDSVWEEFIQSTPTPLADPAQVMCSFRQFYNGAQNHERRVIIKPYFNNGLVAEDNFHA